MADQYTDKQIRDLAHQLNDKGASAQEIEKFVKNAKSSQVLTPTPKDTKTSMLETMGGAAQSVLGGLPRFAERQAETKGPIISRLGGVIDSMNPFAGNNEPGLLETGGKLAWDVGKGMAKAQWDELKKAFQSNDGKAQSNSSYVGPTERIGHGLAGITPLFGPMAASVGGFAGGGDAAAATSDTLDMLLAAGKIPFTKTSVPELVTKPIVKAGEKMYEGAFNFPSDLKMADKKGALRIGKELGVTPTEKNIQVLRTDIQANKAKVDALDLEAQARGVRINPDDISSPLEQTQLRGENTWLPATNSEAFQKFINEFKSHFQSPIEVPEARQFNRNTSETISDRAFGRNAQNVAQPKGEQESNFLLNEGARNALNDANPQAVRFNRDMHDAITLRKSIETIEAKNPGYFDKMYPYIMGSELAGSVYAGATGHPVLAGMGGAGMLVQAAMHSPVVRARLGLVMQNAGQGPISTGLQGVSFVNDSNVKEKR